MIFHLQQGENMTLTIRTWNQTNKKNMGWMKSIIPAWILLYLNFTFNLTDEDHLNAYSNLFIFLINPADINNTQSWKTWLRQSLRESFTLIDDMLSFSFSILHSSEHLDLKETFTVWLKAHSYLWAINIKWNNNMNVIPQMGWYEIELLFEQHGFIDDCWRWIQRNR